LLKVFIDWQDGILVERRLHRRKWKWDKHGAPKGQRLSSITEVQQDESNDATSMFFTTTTGKVFEYQFPKYTGRDSFRYRRSLFYLHLRSLNMNLQNFL
jgi:hypothetical protein